MHSIAEQNKALQQGEAGVRTKKQAYDALKSMNFKRDSEKNNGTMESMKHLPLSNVKDDS